MRSFFVFLWFLFPVLSFSETNSLLTPGTKAPLFSLPTVEGKREALSVWCGDQLSKPYINNTKHTVIINFWATYCLPCKKEIPALQEFYKKHKDKNIKIFLISIDSKENSVVASQVAKNNYTLPVLLDPYKKTAERYGVKSVPSLFVIDEDRNIIYSAKGFKEEDFVASLEKIVFSEFKDSPDSNFNDGISSKEKWRAVAKVECGVSPDSVASKLGITKETLKQWYDDIKGCALKLWEE